jgi:hypothetical protein
MHSASCAGGDDASAARISALRLCWRAVHWFSTGLLIALSAGTAGWAGWLLRRLFVVEPAAASADPGRSEPDDPDDHSEEQHP